MSTPTTTDPTILVARNVTPDEHTVVPGARARNAKTGAARTRALTRLKAMHPVEYRALYTEEMDR